MANLTGMPISSLPETTLQEGDQVVGYRAETGKAYRTDLADQIADLTEQVNQLNQSLSNLNKLSTVSLGTFDSGEDGVIAAACALNSAIGSNNKFGFANATIGSSSYALFGIRLSSARGRYFVFQIASDTYLYAVRLTATDEGVATLLH